MELEKSSRKTYPRLARFIDQGIPTHGYPLVNKSIITCPQILEAMQKAIRLDRDSDLATTTLTAEFTTKMGPTIKVKSGLLTWAEPDGLSGFFVGTIKADRFEKRDNDQLYYT